jgi:hypothetical protein
VNMKKHKKKKKKKKTKQKGFKIVKRENVFDMCLFSHFVDIASS